MKYLEMRINLKIEIRLIITTRSKNGYNIKLYFYFQGKWKKMRTINYLYFAQLFPKYSRIYKSIKDILRIQKLFRFWINVEQFKNQMQSNFY